MKKFLVGALAILLITAGLSFSQTADSGDLELADSFGIMAYKGGYKDIGPMD